MQSRKKILVAPLDWGLGHATRCIPIIRELLNQGAEVLIAADKAPLAILEEEFPQLSFLPLKGYEIVYGRKGTVGNILWQVPKILKAIYTEHLWLKQVISEHQIDIVISDNRYGLFSDQAFCVFIGHQINIQCPDYLKWMEPLLFLLQKRFINRFNTCWVPDFEGEPNLSGSLSHGRKAHTETVFIGPLSRFSLNEEVKRHDVLFLISGPEPQRSIFETILLKEAFNFPQLKITLVRGLPGASFDLQQEGIEIYNHLNSRELERLILSSDLIICRSGYSTVMDLVSLKKNAVFVPTPGQTEQEYLAKHLSEQEIFAFMAQEKFSLEEALNQNFHRQPNTSLNQNLLKNTIVELLNTKKLISPNK